MRIPKVGDPKEVYAVLEFEIMNKYQHDITVGRVNMGGWMFVDHYEREIYDHARDYRVYDLYNDERTSLAPYRLIRTNTATGFRVEAFEHPGSPNANSRLPVELPSKYKIEIQTGIRKRIFRVTVKPKRQKLGRSDEFDYLFSLSRGDLLPERDYARAVPQGVIVPRFREPISFRLRRFWNNWKYKVKRKPQ
ncbi:MAG: hypothetical protein L0332_07000 [Chloroflexi bacterium]|nr:hypothetical protein [Chloroflexota bacterium]MCI0579165.1 hypothetical protein [Chloroflexota bacterium]MCI0647946.1 hypothetical protein [Chloroflexota bacterium]MCI0726456.1 hypothetical protein [Chloroflexota bacterium]